MKIIRNGRRRLRFVALPALLLLGTVSHTALGQQMQLVRQLCAAAGSQNGSAAGSTLSGSLGEIVIGYQSTAALSVGQGFWYMPLNIGSGLPQILSEVDGHDVTVHPNPSRDAVTIRFRLPQAAHVQLSIRNTLGVTVRMLADEDHDAGNRAIAWDGRDNHGKALASGHYMYTLELRSRSEDSRRVSVGTIALVR